MLCSAAPEKVSALNLKRLKADNKACGQSHKPKDRQRRSFGFPLRPLTTASGTAAFVALAFQK